MNVEMTYQLKRFLRVTSIHHLEKKLALTFGYFPDSGYEMECEQTVLQLLFSLSSPVTKNQLTEKIVQCYPNVQQKDIDLVLQKLDDMGMLEKKDVSNIGKVDRYDRHLIYYSMFRDEANICQEKLQQSRVVLIGVGGIGSWLLFCLAGAGVGTIVGVDHDKIELTNLTRQILYREKDVGQIKVEKAQEQMQHYNSTIQFIPINRKVSAADEIKGIIRGADLVILSADSPRNISLLVNQACMEEKIAWSATGYIDMHGVCGPLVIPGKTACLECYATGVHENGTKEYLESVQTINGRYQAPSFGPLNCFVSGLQAMEAIKYLAGYAKPQTLSKRFVFNSKDCAVEWQNVEQNPECSLCQSVRRNG